MATRITRRHFVATTGSAVASIAFGNCVSSAQSRPGHDGRLTARLRTSVKTSLKTGPLGLGDGGRDGMIQMPTVLPDGKVPLLVFLHGASQNGARMLQRIGPAAETLGIPVLAPDSRNGTWDGIRNEFDEDVVFLNRALDFVFERLDVDPARLAIGGFSDGASYGLSLGLVNGDLFPRVVACSPGFIIQAPSHGRPRLFFSHGTSDQVLPIDQCSRIMVPRLRTMGYDVTFKEFDGRHELPPEIALDALKWMTAAG
jgi:phospholipase/carboxylesterase